MPQNTAQTPSLHMPMVRSRVVLINALGVASCGRHANIALVAENIFGMTRDARNSLVSMMKRLTLS